MVNQQVTSLNHKDGTSETACDITFKFNNYLSKNVLHKKINKIFLEWFIGFFEGKGYFIVLKNKVYFNISVSIKDIQVLYYIKKELGFGKVKINKGLYADDKGVCIGDTAYFYVTSFNNFYRLVTLFNGNLCTVGKKEEFKNWLKVFNSQYSKEIMIIDSTIKPSLTTGWLSGYIDAKGNFTGRTTGVVLPGSGNILSSRIPSLNFFIEVNLGEFYILNAIFEALSVKERGRFATNKINYNKDKEGWILNISSFNKIKLIINYLKRYPLKTNKSLAFTKWCKISKIMLNKEHLNEIGLNKIYILTKELNKYL
jgi:hypothetical protein